MLDPPPKQGQEAAFAGLSGGHILRTMLLIDDEPELVRMIAHAAEAAGYAPVATGDADSFKRQFELTRPDLIAIDLGMPEADGIELIRFLAEAGCTAPVLIVSGFDRRVIETAVRLGEALGLEMAGMVEKPVRLEELESLLQSLAGRA